MVSLGTHPDSFHSNSMALKEKRLASFPSTGLEMFNWLFKFLEEMQRQALNPLLRSLLYTLCVVLTAAPAVGFVLAVTAHVPPFSKPGCLAKPH